MDAECTLRRMGRVRGHVGRHESENETGVERARCNSQGGLIWSRSVGEQTISIAGIHADASTGNTRGNLLSNFIFKLITDSHVNLFFLSSFLFRGFLFAMISKVYVLTYTFNCGRHFHRISPTEWPYSSKFHFVLLLIETRELVVDSSFVNFQRRVILLALRQLHLSPRLLGKVTCSERGALQI